MGSRRLLPALPALACALLIAACGSGSGSAPSASPTAPATVTRTSVTRTTVTEVASATGTASTTSTSPTATTTGSLPATAAPMCVAADLALSSLGGSGATGHLLLGFALRNVSKTSCRTGGYPGVLFLGGAGHGLPTTPDHTTDDFFGHTVLRELTLAPGQLASFRLGVTDVGSGGSSAGCETARGLQVIPPNDTATLRITRRMFECGGTVSVSPLQAGTAALR